VAEEAGVAHINATKNGHYLSEQYHHLKRRNDEEYADLELQNPETDKLMM